MSVNPIEAVATKLQQYPQAIYRVLPNNDGFEIEAPNVGGFYVSLVNDDPEWTVHAGESGAHWHLSDPEEALNLVSFCLSEDCRLKIEKRTFQVRSTLERRNEDGWSMAWQFGVFALRLWRPWCMTFFQNKLVPSRTK